MNSTTSKNGRYQSTMRPSDVRNVIDTEVANMMGDKREHGAATLFPDNYLKPAGDHINLSSAPESSGLFTKSLGFLNKKLGILQGDSKVPVTMPKNSRAKMPQGDINKKARDAIID